MAACCRPSGAPIPGLYACGNDMASIMRGHYPGPGITLGPGHGVRLSRRDGDRRNQGTANKTVR